jgi:Icc-related predicted phosphoesterase
MKIWHISDTHGNHEKLVVPDDIDIVIHSGDASNDIRPVNNLPEVESFLQWYADLKIPNKVFVAGNHETSIGANLFNTHLFEENGIHYLRETEVVINGLKIWGCPMVPSYGKWAFMAGRASLNKYWQQIPDDTDIVVTHGPPLGILDMTYSVSNEIELAGCSALQKKLFKLDPKLSCFGHIHNCDNLYNSGLRTVNGLRTIFSNASCSTDGKWGVLSSNGNVITL